MKRIQNLTVFAAIFVTVHLAMCSHGFGQTNQSLDGRLIEKFVVQHASVMHAREVLEAALEGGNSQLIPDDNGNSFVVIGSADSIDLARAAIAKIDQKSQPQALATTQFIPLKNVKVERVAGTIEHLMTNPDCKIVADGVTNSFVVAASEDRIGEIRQLIEMLDRSMANEQSLESDQSNDCQLRLSWLVESSSFSEADQKLLREVRPSLRKLTEHLASEGGAKEIVSLTDVQILTGDGQFTNSSTRKLDLGSIVVSIAGDASRDGNKFDLSLDLTFYASGQEVNLESRFSAPVDHPVAFSVSDIGGIRSILVVEVSVPDHK